MLRLTVVLVAMAGCANSGTGPKQSTCSTGKGDDPGACLTAAAERLSAQDEAGARLYVEAAVDALEASPSCLAHHDPKGCFQTVVALLDEEPVGLLAEFSVGQDLRLLAPKDQGDDATNPRGRARNALRGMCGSPTGDPIDRERACIVLGDLVTEERAKRCGDGCDVETSKLGGWGKTEVIDGYVAACKVASAPPAPGASDKRLGAFNDEVKRLYAVTASGAPACSVAESARKGASITDALDNMHRIAEERRAKAAALKNGDLREQTRLAQLRQNAVGDAAKAQQEADEQAARQLKVALDSANWALAYELIRKRTAQSSMDEASATALSRVWDSFLAWSIAQATPMAVYLDVADSFATLPAGHPLTAPLAELRNRALSDLKGRGKSARGLGASWLYAALAARVAGRDSPEARTAFERYEKLVAAVRVSVVIDKLSPACAGLVKEVPGRRIRATSTLTCTLIPEKKWTAQEPMTIKQHVVHGDTSEDVEQQVNVEVTHRAFSVIVHGAVTVQGKAVPVDFEEVLDDTEGSSVRTFDQARQAAIAVISNAVVGPLESAAAASELTAGQNALKVQRQAAAEDHLVNHGLLVGSSPELDELLTPYGVTFDELVFASR